jgi:hypothetical protein
MPQSIFVHLRANAVAYLALFIALGGSSYAAVRIAPASVTSRALARRAVTHAKLAPNSVTAGNVRNRSLTSADFQPGAVLKGLKGDAGSAGPAGAPGLASIPALKGESGAAGPAGAQGPAGHDGSASIGASPRSQGTVTGAHGASTSIPVSGGSWTQSAGELDLITGNVSLKIPATCTGSFGNLLVLSIDGKAQTFAVAPPAPASASVTVPFVVGTLSPPDGDTPRTLTAALGNSCTKDGEDYTVSDLTLDIVKFR